jgi:hypothetical protein
MASGIPSAHAGSADAHPDSMFTYPHQPDGPTAGNTDHTAPVTRERVQARTREIALRAGRTPPHILQADYEQAKRELTGVSDLDGQEAILDAITKANPSAPAPGR